MSGTDTIKGINYQNSYTLYRVLDLLDEEKQVVSVAAEGKGMDVEDLTITFADDTEESIQVKKRETREGQFGLWTLSAIKSIIEALYELFQSEREIEILRFVATGNAHPRVIAIQKACQRLRDDTYSSEKDFKAVTDIQEMTGGSEKKTLDFMEKLWLDVPLESEEFFEDAVQNRLMKVFDVASEEAEKVYNDLYKRVLDIGRETNPEDRVIDQQMLMEWLDNLPEGKLSEKTRLKVQQRVKILRNQLIGMDLDEIEAGSNYGVIQDVDEANGPITGIKAKSVRDGSARTKQNIKKVDESGSVKGMEIDEF